MTLRSTLVLAAASVAVLAAGCTAKPAPAVSSTSAPAPAATSASATSAAPAPTRTATSTDSATASPSAASATSSPSTSSASPSASASATGMQQLQNARFGFRASYPSGWQLSNGNGNGDGFTATAPDGANVTYAGANVVAAPGMPAPCDLARQTLKASGVTLTYDTATSDGCAFSGTRAADGHILYERLWVGTGSRNSMVWDYPAADQGSVGPMVDQASSAFTPGDLSAAH